MSFTLIRLEVGKLSYKVSGMGRFVRAWVWVSVDNTYYELQPLAPSDYTDIVEQEKKKGLSFSAVSYFVSRLGPEQELFVYPRPSEPWDMLIDWGVA
jgi:hypothetical protein